MHAKTANRSPMRKATPIIVVLIVIGLVAGGIAMTRSPGLAASSSKVPTFEVREGPLVINVIESGTIQSQDQVILKSEVEGQSTLIYLIDEGTSVEKETLLVELDSSSLSDRKVEQEISVQNAEASFIQARENLAVVKNQAESDISAAQLALDFAREDVSKYRDGEYPQQLREAESRITIAREEMERAAEKLKWSERLLNEKYISQTEYEADRLAHERAKLDHELAVAAKDLLVNYTNKRELAQLESDVVQADMALKRTRLSANADIVQAEATLKAREAEYGQQQSKLAKLQEQIVKTKIYAPRDGVVVYATSTQFSRRGNTEPLDEGQSVRERQELIYLPSTNEMMAEVMVHESNLEKIRVGHPVVVSADALPHRTFMGRVGSIAPFPDARSMWMNPDLKLYAAKVHLEGRNPDLRTGMSCQAEIVIQELDKAVYVPTQAIVRINGQATAFVREGDGFSARNVEIGLDNNSMVHVKSGLSAGEMVSLVPPLQTGLVAASPTGPRFAEQPDAEPAQSGTPQMGARRDSRTSDSRASDSRTSDAEPATSTASQEVATAAAENEDSGTADRPRSAENMSEEDRAAMRERFQNMTPEERAAAWQERMKNMSPEDRERFERMRQRGGGEGRRDRDQP